MLSGYLEHFNLSCRDMHLVGSCRASSRTKPRSRTSTRTRCRVMRGFSAPPRWSHAVSRGTGISAHPARPAVAHLRIFATRALRLAAITLSRMGERGQRTRSRGPCPPVHHQGRTPVIGSTGAALRSGIGVRFALFSRSRHLVSEVEPMNLWLYSLTTDLGA
jgi:hypothetical protein